MAVRIVQISDCHLLADPDARLKGVFTREALLDVLRLVRDELADSERLILTGDLAHDEEPATYRWLRDALGDWLPRCRIIPGNHDDRAAIRDVFPDIVPEQAGPLTFAESVGGWRLIGLDSQAPGEACGRLGPVQLEWLREQLARDPEAPALLFVHHPPVSVGSAWLDRIGLEDGAGLMQILSAARQMRAVCVGHIHQAFDQRGGSVPVLAAPATCWQYRPGTPAPMYDLVAPGCRVLELDGDRLRTRVIRLPELRHRPS